MLTILHRFLLNLAAIAYLFFCSTVDYLHATNLEAYVADISVLTVNDGLADNTIYSIEQDQQGFIYLGTPVGLSRFDGHRFHNFTAGNDQVLALANSNAGNIKVDSTNQFWVGSWGQGVYVYDHNLKLLEHFTDIGEGEFVSNRIQVLFEDSEGDIWIGTNGGGLALYKKRDKTFQYFVSNNDIGGLSHNRIWDIEEGKPGEIWVATGAGVNKITKQANNIQISRFNGEEFFRRNEEESILVRTLYYSEAGNLWIGTETSLFVMNQMDGQVTEVANKPLLSISRRTAITSITEGQGANLWIGTQNGVLLYNTETETFIPLTASNQYYLLPHYDIRALLYDDSGVLWAASRSSGLIKVTLGVKTNNNIDSYTTADGKSQPLNRVSSLLLDSNGNLWFGSTEGLMKRPKNTEQIRRYLPALEHDMGRVTAILEGKDGTLWFGSSTSLFRQASESDEIENVTSLLVNQSETDTVPIATIFQDSRGNVWVGTYRYGLFRIDGDTVHRQTLFNENASPNQTVLSITEDHRGFIWIGTNGSGAFRLSPYNQSNNQYGQDGQTSSGLSSQEVTHIFRDSKNTIWIGTKNKLNRLDSLSNSFIVYDQEAGLANTNITSVLEDADQNLWVSTSSSVYRFDPRQDFFVSFSDGNSNSSYRRNSSIATESELYFGKMDGVTRISTQYEEKQNSKSKVRLSAVSVNNSVLPYLNYDTQEVFEFAHTAKEFLFQFSDTLRLRNASINNYSYRLLGYDSDWSPVTQANQAEYRGLLPGSYVFEVKSITDLNENQLSVAQFKFNVIPPWWERWEFRLVVFLFLCLCVYLWKQTRLKKLKYINAQLENQVATRTADLLTAEKQLVESAKNASLSSLISGISHEINTPVGIGVTASSMLKERAYSLVLKFKQNEMKRSDFINAMDDICKSSDLVFDNLNRTSELIENFKKVSVDQISQQKREFNLKTYLDEIALGLSSIIKNNKIKFSITCEEDIWLNSYPGAIAQMVTQLMLNAAEHAFDEQQIRVANLKVTSEGKFVFMEFSDNGLGIEEEIQNRIFEPFFTTERSAGSKGLGLQIVANVATIRLQGEISVESNKLEGTTFKIKFMKTPD